MASGPIESVSIDGRRFPVDGEADVALSLSGYINEMKPNGDGSVRMVKSVKPARVNSIPIVIDDARGDEEFIQAVMDSLVPVNIEMTAVDAIVWSGTGQIVEDPETSKKVGTKDINLHGLISRQV